MGKAHGGGVAVRIMAATVNKKKVLVSKGLAEFPIQRFPTVLWKP